MTKIILYPDTYSSKEVAALSGLPKTKVDYLCWVGLVTPSGMGARGRGKARKYTFGDVVMLRAVARFLSAGVHVSDLRKALTAIRNRHSDITPNSLPADLIITDGKCIYFKNKNETLETLDQGGQMSFAFVLELSSVRNEVIAEWSNLKKAGGF